MLPAMSLCLFVFVFAPLSISGAMDGNRPLFWLHYVPELCA